MNLTHFDQGAKVCPFGGAFPQLARLTIISSRMHHSECRRRGLEGQMQIIAVGLRGVVEAIGSDRKKQVKLPEQPETDCENVI